MYDAGMWNSSKPKEAFVHDFEIIKKGLKKSKVSGGADIFKK